MDVDKLISNMKKFFIKAPLRTEAFKSMPLPHKPLITRWRAWLVFANITAKIIQSSKQLLMVSVKVTHLLSREAKNCFVAAY